MTEEQQVLPRVSEGDWGAEYEAGAPPPPQARPQQGDRPVQDPQSPLLPEVPGLTDGAWSLKIKAPAARTDGEADRAGREV